MPETFSGMLEEIADAGRERMRPFPASAVHELAREITVRRRIVGTATAGVIAVVAAVGVVVIGPGGGAAPAGSTSTTPGPSAQRTAPPITTLGSTGTPSAATTGHTFTPSMSDSGPTPPAGDWLTTAELPFAAKFQWAVATPALAQPVGQAFSPPGCAAAGSLAALPSVWIESWENDPQAGFAAREAFEEIYVFPTTADAEQALATAKADAVASQCHETPAGNDTTDTTFGAAASTVDSVSYDETYVQVGVPESNQPSHLHHYFVRKGDTVVWFSLNTNSSIIDDTSGDAAILAMMLAHVS